MVLLTEENMPIIRMYTNLLLCYMGPCFHAAEYGLVRIWFSISCSLKVSFNPVANYTMIVSHCF
jgi:hypothetical protein